MQDSPTQPNPKPKKSLYIISWTMFGLSVLSILVAPFFFLLFATLIAGMFGASVATELNTVNWGAAYLGALGAFGILPFIGGIFGFMAARRSGASWAAFIANAILWLICAIAFFAGMA